MNALKLFQVGAYSFVAKNICPKNKTDSLLKAHFVGFRIRFADLKR